MGRFQSLRSKGFTGAMKSLVTQWPVMRYPGVQARPSGCHSTDGTSIRHPQSCAPTDTTDSSTGSATKRRLPLWYAATFAADQKP